MLKCAGLTHPPCRRSRFLSIVSRTRTESLRRFGKSSAKKRHAALGPARVRAQRALHFHQAVVDRDKQETESEFAPLVFVSGFDYNQKTLTVQAWLRSEDYDNASQSRSRPPAPACRCPGSADCTAQVRRSLSVSCSA
jgi:hypothetical protein